MDDTFRVTPPIKDDGLFDSLFEDAEDAAFGLDRRTRTVLACNPAVTRMFGYPIHEMIGSTLRMVHASDAEFERFDRAVLAADASGAYVGRFKMRRRQGGIFPTSHRIVPVRMHRGREFLVGIVCDESEIRDRQAEHEAVLADLPSRIEEAPDRRHALAAILEMFRYLHGWDYGEARTPFDGNELEMAAASFDRGSVLHRFCDVSRIVTYKRGEGMAGRVLKSGSYEWLPDLKGVSPRVFVRIVSAMMLGLRSCYCVAVRSEGKTLAVLMFASRCPRAADQKIIDESLAILRAVAGSLAQKPAVVCAAAHTAEIDAAAAPPQVAPADARSFSTYPVLAMTMGHEANPVGRVRTMSWSRFERLTPREGEVLAHIMIGASNKSIARALGISHRTVEVHRLSIWRKLRVHSLKELLVMYMRNFE